MKRIVILSACAFALGWLITLQYFLKAYNKVSTITVASKGLTFLKQTSGFAAWKERSELPQNKFLNSTSLENASRNTNLRDIYGSKQQNTPDLLERSASPWAKHQCLIKTPGHRVYLYSAVGYRHLDLQINGLEDRHETTSGFIAITAWKDRDLRHLSFSCCITSRNGNTERALSSAGVIHLANSILEPTLFKCPLYSHPEEVHGITVVLESTFCPANKTTYIQPFFPNDKRNAGLAVCSKLAYGHLNLIALVEWFEMQRFLGVDKILVNIHVSSISPESIQVFEYYESVGLAWLLPYDIPENDTTPRALYEKTTQVWNDEYITVLDCQARLNNFKYITILDKDEIILPNTIEQDALKLYLESELGRRSDAAGIKFQTQLHLTLWKETEADERQFFSNYRQCSTPLDDRTKNVVMPSRISLFSMHSHQYLPREGYKRLFADPNEAIIHHYRKPRKSYSGVKGPIKPDGKCDKMIMLTNRVRKDVERVLNLFNL